MRSIPNIFVPVALLIALLCSLSLARMPAKPLAEIQLGAHPGGTYMMTIAATANGHEGLFMFDTGGGISYVDPQFAKAANCDPWGQISGFMLTGQRLDMLRCDGLTFDVAGRHLVASTAGIYDIGKFMPPNTPRIDGSIGLDVFAGQVVTLSLADKKLTVESPDSLRARVKRAKEVPVRLVREVQGLSLSVVVGVETSKGTAWMELDSGNGGANVIGKHLAAIVGLDPEKKEPQPGRISLVGGIVVDGPFRVNPTLTMDGNIGTHFLIDHDLTLDLAACRAWISPAGPQH